MKIFLYFGLPLFLISSVYSQSGCTDPEANNYNSLAVTNDGSCTYDVTTQAVHSKGLLNSYANESSGLVFTNGALWTHNDSGNPSKIFKTDTTNGSLLQTISITNFINNDWEDITSDTNYLYVGDFGNNDGMRTDLKVLKIDKSQFLTSTLSIVNATAQAINFSYSDQTSFASNGNTNFDCESVISIGSFLYLFTKDRGDFQTRVYKLSKTPGTYTISPYTSYNVNGKITGADFNAQKKEVALIGYLSSSKNSFMYFLNDFTGDMFFSGNKRRIEIGNSTNDWQTEGIAYAGLDSNQLFLSCETSYTPATLYSTNKTSRTFVGIQEFKEQSIKLKIYPNPTNDYIKISSENIITNIEIISLTGEIIFSKETESNSITINTKDLNIKPGCYILHINAASKSAFEKLLINSLF